MFPEKAGYEGMERTFSSNAILEPFNDYSFAFGFFPQKIYFAHLLSVNTDYITYSLSLDIEFVHSVSKFLGKYIMQHVERLFLMFSWF